MKALSNFFFYSLVSLAGFLVYIINPTINSWR